MIQYLRFVHGQKIPDVGYRAGFLDAAYELRDVPSLDGATHARIDEYIQWFVANLPEPYNFRRSSTKNYNKNTKGLSWFKDHAFDHVAKAYEVTALLRDNGVETDVLKSARVGYVVYEDDWQVVAEPFSDTPA